MLIRFCGWERKDGMGEGEWNPRCPKARHLGQPSIAGELTFLRRHLGQPPEGEEVVIAFILVPFQSAGHGSIVMQEWVEPHSCAMDAHEWGIRRSVSALPCYRQLRFASTYRPEESGLTAH